jgi:hypothetical protein
MSKLISNNFKLFNSDQFIESFSEANYDVYYMFVGRPRPYTDDANPPTLYDTVRDTYLSPYEDMIYGKRISSSDIVSMAPRHNWVANTVYTKYSHDSNSIFQSAFYVVVDEGLNYTVFKCLDNNRGGFSTYEPNSTETSPSDDVYITPDGYQWKYMYSVASSTFDRFATVSYIPVIANTQVSGNAVPGSIDNIEVTLSGNGYASYANGTFQEVRVGGNELIYALDPTLSSSNSNFYVGCALKIVSGTGAGQMKKINSYNVSGSTRRVTVDSAFEIGPTNSSTYEISPLVTITGDGTGATGRAIVNSTSNSIYRVEIVNRGQNYTYASVSITGNTGIINVATSSAVLANSATAKAIISPKGGHGSNTAAELGAHYVGISIGFDSSLSGDRVVDENDFRVAGIIKNPLFANVVLTLSSASGTFQDEEVVTQANTGAYGVVVSANSTSVKLSNAYGFFLTGNSTVNLLSGSVSGYTAICDSVSQPTTYFDQTTKFVASLQTANNFVEDESVYQVAGNAYFYSSNNTVMRVVDPRGTFVVSDISTTEYVDGANSMARASISAIIPPDLVRNTGDVIYIENFTPVTKSVGQTETLKLVLEF